MGGQSRLSITVLVISPPLLGSKHLFQAPFDGSPPLGLSWGHEFYCRPD